MAAKKDPTVTTTATAEPPEGTHPAVPVSEGADAADKLEYRDMSGDEKPDKTTIAQVQVVDES